jgi:hypothetical protein
MNIEYVGFPSLCFQRKHLYVMFVFSIVSFYSFIENLFGVNILQGQNLHLVLEICWLQGGAFVVKGLSRDCDKPCYSGRSVVLIFQVKINGKQFEN